VKPDCRFCEHARVKYIFTEPTTVADILKNGFVTFPIVHGGNAHRPLEMDIFCRMGYWKNWDDGQEIRFNTTGALDGIFIRSAADGCGDFEEMD